jgi:16S rRNA (guanine966-N2)-methyltransferase
VRVIAGSAKGVRLGPVPPGTRPVSDMAREGLFASLGPGIEGARVLDLFAGTGAVGIEALSRGATDAVFVERSPKAVAAIRDNLSRAKLGDSGRVIRAEVGPWLAKHIATQGSFDIVTLDPPYDLAGPPLDRSLEALDRGWLAGQGWTVVLTRGHKSSMPVVPVHWAVRRQLRYGDSLLTLYREERWA